MRKTAVLLLLAISTVTNGQKFKNVYYNKNWQITSDSNCAYYRNSGFNPRTLAFDSLVIDHYCDGKTEMTGEYINGIKSGSFLYYFPGGNLRFESNYLNNRRTGKWISYFENGKVEKAVEYNGGKERLLKYCDINGNDILKDLTGKLNRDIYINLSTFAAAESPESDEYVHFKVNGQLKNGYKDGTWKIYKFDKYSEKIDEEKWRDYEKRNPLYKIIFSKGEFVEGYEFSFLTKVPFDKDTLTYLILEPSQIKTTEALVCEPGKRIRQNYVLAPMVKSANQPPEQVELNNEAELNEYFGRQFSIYVKNCSDTFRIRISLNTDNLGKLTIDTINRKVSASVNREIYRILGTISDIKLVRNKKLEINHRVQCLSELDGRK